MSGLDQRAGHCWWPLGVLVVEKQSWKKKKEEEDPYHEAMAVKDHPLLLLFLLKLLH